MFGLQVSGEQTVFYLEAGNKWSTTGVYPRTHLVPSDLEEARA